MSSVVLDLQAELVSSECDILNALRKAHIIAVKLNLKEFDGWINQELGGYKSNDNVPQYRSVKGLLQVNNPNYGWCPAIIPDISMENYICRRNITSSISCLLELYAKSSTQNIHISFPGEQILVLYNYFNTHIPMEFALLIDSSAIKAIIEHVKDTLLQWTLKLEEEGITGEGLKFSEKEKAIAKAIPQTVNKYYGTTSIINAPIYNSQIVSGENNNATFNYALASDSISEIQTAINNSKMTPEDKSTALELVEEIKEKIDNKKKPSIIRAALKGLKDFVVSVGARVVAFVIESKMQGLF